MPSPTCTKLAGGRDRGARSGEQGVVVRRTYGQPMEAPYFHRFEVGHSLGRCGFEVEALYGDPSRDEFMATASSMIWVVRRSP